MPQIRLRESSCPKKQTPLVQPRAASPGGASARKKNQKPPRSTAERIEETFDTSKTSDWTFRDPAFGLSHALQNRRTAEENEHINRVFTGTMDPNAAPSFVLRAIVFRAAPPR